MNVWNILLIVGGLIFIALLLFACCKAAARADEQASRMHEVWLAATKDNKTKGEIPSNAEAEDPASPIA